MRFLDSVLTKDNPLIKSPFSVSFDNGDDSPPPGVSFRITDSNDMRITDSGDNRITDN